MNGLGFRPLRYQDGTGQQGVETPGMTYENAMEYIRWIHGEGSGNLPPVEQMSKNSLAQAMAAWLDNPEAAISYATRLKNLVDWGTSSEVAPGFIEGSQPTRQGVYDDAVRSETFEQFRGTQPTIGVNEAGWEALRRGETLSEETPELLGAPAYTEGMTETWQGLTNPPQGTSPFGAQYQAGGYVGRGTMAGELGHRGDLSVRQAGETMFERMKRLRGYAGGGYASRGTVAGELPRYGNMSVREEGETMRELSKRHRDQDWYNHMSGGLGSLRRRMA